MGSDLDEVGPPVALIAGGDGLVGLTEGVVGHPIDQVAPLGVMVATTDLGEQALAKLDQFGVGVVVEEAEHRVGRGQIVDHGTSPEQGSPLHGHGHATGHRILALHRPVVGPFLDHPDEAEGVALVGPHRAQVGSPGLAAGEFTGPPTLPRIGATGRRGVHPDRAVGICRHEVRGSHGQEGSLKPLQRWRWRRADIAEEGNERTTPMGTDSALYQIVLLLHIAAAIVGFGGMITHSTYHARAFRAPAEAARAVLEATKGVAKWADYGIYAVLPLGIVAIAVSDSTFSMGDPWVSASFVVWFALVGVLHGLVRPAVKAMTARAEAIGGSTVLETDDEAAAASRKLMMGEAISQILVVVALFLMIWKPGA